MGVTFGVTRIHRFGWTEVVRPSCPKSDDYWTTAVVHIGVWAVFAERMPMDFAAIERQLSSFANSAQPEPRCASIMLYGGSSEEIFAE